VSQSARRLGPLQPARLAQGRMYSPAIRGRPDGPRPDGSAAGHQGSAAFRAHRAGRRRQLVMHALTWAPARARPTPQNHPSPSRSTSFGKIQSGQNRPTDGLSWQGQVKFRRRSPAWRCSWGWRLLHVRSRGKAFPANFGTPRQIEANPATFVTAQTVPPEMPRPYLLIPRILRIRPVVE